MVTPSINLLQTDHLVLRPFSCADGNEVFAEITPTLTRFMAFDPPDSLAAFEKIGQEWVRLIEEGSEYTFVIRHLQDGRFMGIAAVHDATEDEPELGIWISEREHGHGYGGEAVRAVVHWCAERLAAVAYRYPVAVENVASRKIAEGLGGRVVGTEQNAKFASVVYRIPASEPVG
ncbi:GNAT family N-acetyltransferase [Stenotrophomonas sp. NA06056]|uniref:GNAT family N-acetyltransferase n=1 Tax=Stenotrophomonas sp. NA06056 TaxID=2742129 RepID=UPI00158A800B|nr:GNAT family N-acetyltransferase [Stenotrophomonas sp. NA06056]QKW57077.1 GNAT family N-acetyltransferase [Stenotrophomonas sp. NA06056]